MKKLLLISLLSFFSLNSAHAQDATEESNSFVIPEDNAMIATPPSFFEAPPETLGLGPMRPSEKEGGIFMYQDGFEQIARTYLGFLAATANDDFATLPAQEQKECGDRYNTVLNDKKIDIRIAFGYFDWSSGVDVIMHGFNYGKSPSSDIGGAKAMEKILMAPCTGPLQICGFTKQTSESYFYSKQVEIRGQMYTAEVRLSQPSLTESYVENSIRRDEQAAKSQKTREFYMQALQDADFAIYLGHSREGGGPDFNPPILKEDGHTNYKGYYIPNKFGLKMMIEALSKSGRQAPIVAVLSCDSREHFYKDLSKVAPRTGLITTTKIDLINNLFAGSVGAMDALLRGKCQKSFYRSMRLDPAFNEMITMDNMFN